MALVNWSRNFETGHPVIDNQHMTLVALLNKFGAACRSGDPAEAVAVILQELKSYSGFHFATEERIMQETGYPDLAGHRAEHEKFVEDVEEFEIEYLVSGKNELAVDILRFLVKWVSEHILDCDRKLGDFLKTDKPEG